MYLNKALIYGNLTRDPELRALPSGSHVASFGVATNRVYKDKEGRQQEATEFHNIVVFGRQAEVAGQYLKKGRGVLIEGRLQTRSWESDGRKNYRTEIVADRIQFGPGGVRGGGGGAGDVESTPSPKSSPESEEIQYPDEDIKPEDIPF